MAQPAASSRNLGEILLREGLITQDQYNQGLREYENTERPLSRIFVEMGAITEGVKIGVLQKRCECELLNLQDIAPRPDAIRRITRRHCEKFHVVPVKIEDGRLVVAMEDPTDSRTINALEAEAGMPIRPVLAKTADITNVISRLPETEEAPAAAQEHGALYRTLSHITLPLLVVVPILTFLLLLIYNREVNKFFRDLELDSFEQILFFVLAWCGWAIVAYWVDDILFKRSQKE